MTPAEYDCWLIMSRPGSETLSVLDNRTGKLYVVPVQNETISALDFKQIQVNPHEDGLRCVRIAAYRHADELLASTIQHIKTRPLPNRPSHLSTAMMEFCGALALVSAR